MQWRVQVEGRILTVRDGENLLEILRRVGLGPDAPCGGNGTCGKCAVKVDGQTVLSCGYSIHRDVAVELLPKTKTQIMTEGPAVAGQAMEGYALAIDIGTTTVVCYLLAPDGREVAVESMENPQRAFGADVVSRIRCALRGEAENLDAVIRSGLQSLILRCCVHADILPDEIRLVSVVGNSCMQQMFLGLPVDNLARPPFAPALTQGNILPAKEFLPVCVNAQMLVWPDIGGFVGADTIGGILSSGIHEAQDTVLLVDIGTNGEMVLCHRGRMICCATAAGPALEGAQIQLGMRSSAGAIDHVSDQGCSVIGGGEALGICGSGLIDAVAVMLKKGILNRRGRILTEDHIYHLTDRVYLTQEDIRHVQLAKGAIAAGIECMAQHIGIGVEEIDRCILAGAFGTFMDPENACRIGLLPEELRGKITAMGNLAGSGAKRLAMDPGQMNVVQRLADNTEYLELSQMPGFQRIFAKTMTFREETWLVQARSCGFTHAAYLDPKTLTSMQAVRDACSADKCRAYGKNWTCPPHCGSLEECDARLKQYTQGILLQTVGVLQKTIDTKGYARAEQAHLEAFQRFCDGIREAYPHALCLGSGGCRICKDCAWPQSCRFPDKAYSSLEAYGLFVTQVCRDGGLQYHYGEKTITYTACVLF